MPPRKKLVDLVLDGIRERAERDPALRRAIEEGRGELEARRAARRAPAPPKRQLPSAGRRGKR